MTALYIVLGILAFLLLILLWPVSFRVSFRVSYRDELLIKARILGIPVTLFPGREKPEKPKQEKPGKKPSKRKKRREAEQEKLLDLSRMLKEDGIGGTLHYFRELAAMLMKAARRALRAITIRKLWLRIHIGGDDASTVAIQYGRVCAALFPAVELVGGLVKIGKRDIEVTPAFLSENSGAQLDIRIWVTPLRVLWAGLCLVCSFAFRFSRQEIDTDTTQEKSKTQEVVNHG